MKAKLINQELMAIISVCLLLFIPIHAPQDILILLFPFTDPLLFPVIKKVLFAAGLVLSMLILYREFQTQGLKKSRATSQSFWPQIGICFGIGFLVMIIFIPLQFPYWGVRNSGVDYAKQMSEPFMQSTGWFYRRLLPIAIPYFAGFSIAFDYAPFTYLYVWCFVVALAGSLKRFFKGLNFAQILLLTMSLCSPLLTFAYTYPGYPEFLGLAIYLCTFWFKIKPKAAAILVALSLSCGDQLLFFIVPFEIFLRGHRKIHIEVCTGIYMALWITNIGMSQNVLAAQAVMPGAHAYRYILQDPDRFFIGLLASQKLLWIVPFMYVFHCWHQKNFRMAFKYMITLTMALIVVLFAGDTSRLANTALPFIIYGLYWLYTRSKIRLNTLLVLVSINFLLPSVSYFTHSGWEPGKGLYTWLFSVLFSRF